MKKLLLHFLILFSLQLFAKNDPVVVLSEATLNSKTILLNQPWKFHSGDDLNWASAHFKDSLWENAEINFAANDTSIRFSGIGWFRIQLLVNEQMIHQPLALLLSQQGASEIYLDGKLLQAFGTPSSSASTEKKYTPNNLPFIFEFTTSGLHTLAVRYSHQTAKQMQRDYFEDVAGFTLSIGKSQVAIQNAFNDAFDLSVLFIFFFTFFITLAFVHFLLYIFYQAQKSNLFYSLFILLFGFFFLFPVALQNSTDPTFQSKLGFLLAFIIPTFFTALLGFILSLFHPIIPKRFWYICTALVLILIAKFLRIEPGIISFSYTSMVTIMGAIEVCVAIYKKKKGGWAIGIAAISFLLLIIILLAKNALGYGTGFTISADNAAGIFLFTLLIVTILGIPVSMSIFLARDFSQTSKHLSRKLIEVEELSAKNIEQEKEKQRILANQNEELEVQVKERTSEISEQKKIIEEKNKDITDSINYAKRIQEALLPEKEHLNRLFPDSFILFKPKDIVSGDFYWFTEIENKKIIVAADCTGHGVPGALMSMIGSNTLNKLISENVLTEPGKILNTLHIEVRKALKQHDPKSQTRDGMDIVVVTIEGNQLQYAGAQRPLWLIRNGQFEETKANKFSIGGIQTEEQRIFDTHTIELTKGDCIYLSSDGYADQFGGESGKKLMTKNFKALLLNMQSLPMDKQCIQLDNTIDTWRGRRDQIDDILVIGIRI